MASPSPELRAVFAHAVNDARSEEFLCWLAAVDARIHEIAPHLDLLDVTNPGWLDLWEQDASLAEVVGAVVALDFEFESAWELYGESAASSTRGP